MNPRACHETELLIAPTETRRSIAVVGAGPAGLSAAVTAAMNTAQYGPDFKTEAAWKILLGWLITIVAAAQGAPFWFSAIRRVAGR